MKIFLDTADYDSIKEAVSWGIVDGVTTNPSLIKKAVRTLRESGNDINMDAYIKKILAVAGRMSPVSLEVAGITENDIVEQGIVLYERFNQVAGNVTIKVPVCTLNGRDEGDPFDGIKAISRLSDEKIPINATLVFTPEQAVLAAKAGADYVSPFAGRVDDRIRSIAGIEFSKEDYFPADGIQSDRQDADVVSDHGLVSGVDLVARTVEILRAYDMECEVIAVSIRNPVQVRELALVDTDIVTVPFHILREMIQHPGTVDGIDAFTADLVEEYTDLFLRSDAENQ